MNNKNDLSGLNDPITQYCHGVIPLRPYLSSWSRKAVASPKFVEWLEEYKTPLNIHNLPRFSTNLYELFAVGEKRSVPVTPYFARKANKCLSYIDAASNASAGIDTASEEEVIQALARGVKGSKIICTAASKNRKLVTTCITHGVTLVIDNSDEAQLILDVARTLTQRAMVALRLSGFKYEGQVLHSRFGVPVEHALAFLTQRILKFGEYMQLLGLHFHLDGYDVRHRIAAITQTLEIIRLANLMPTSGESDVTSFFIDIGGGLPTRYLEDKDQWETWKKEHARALLGKRDPITRDNHAIGRVVVNNRVYGNLHCYPPTNEISPAIWLTELLDATVDNLSVAQMFINTGIELRCEPGRSVLSGCGITVSRVVHRKQDTRGNWIIGLDINRTQSRSGFTEHMADPILVKQNSDRRPTLPINAYLSGTYCTESEWLTLRKMCFPEGVAVGDAIVFPNTAGYLMHFVESRSHQFPLAKNIFISHGEGGWTTQVDEIDLS